MIKRKAHPIRRHESRRRSFSAALLLAVLFPISALKAEQTTQQTVGPAVEKEYQELERKAQGSLQRDPNLLKSEAMKQEATKEADINLASHPGKGQAYHAANMFFGFWSLNARTRPDFCKALGVDISTFTKTFIKLHQVQLERARFLWAEEKFDVDAVYASSVATYRTSVQTDMEDEAKENGFTSLRDACRSFEVHGVQYANDLNLVNVQPNVNKALMQRR